MSERPVRSVITGLPRPRWRGLIHQWAFWLAIPPVVGLLLIADRLETRVGAALFGGSLLAVYGVSAAYHRLTRTDRAQQIMRRLDHSMIFVLIAGTYTPVCLVALPRSWWVPLLAVVWGITVIGVATKALGSEWIVRASNSLYLVMGWLGVIALPIFIRTLPTAALALLMLGGLLYTVGAVLFYLGRPDPNPAVFGYHEIWHSFTVLAGISHLAMVAIVIA